MAMPKRRSGFRTMAEFSPSGVTGCKSKVPFHLLYMVNPTEVVKDGGDAKITLTYYPNALFKLFALLLLPFVCLLKILMWVYFRPTKYFNFLSGNCYKTKTIYVAEESVDAFFLEFKEFSTIIGYTVSEFAEEMSQTNNIKKCDYVKSDVNGFIGKYFVPKEYEIMTDEEKTNKKYFLIFEPDTQFLFPCEYKYGNLYRVDLPRHQMKMLMKGKRFKPIKGNFKKGFVYMSLDEKNKIPRLYR